MRVIFTAVVRLRGESDSGVEGIGKFDREACLANLLRVGGRKAHKLRPHIVNNEKIAVRAVVIAQPQIRADGLRVRAIQLESAAKRQESREGIVPLQARQIYREISLRQSKPVPGLCCGNGKLCCGAVVRPDAKFVQGPAVIAAEALKKIVGKPAVLPRSVSKLVPREMVQAAGNENILINV